MAEPTLAQLLTKETLERSALGSAYSFGRRYLKTGRVSDLMARADRVSARVRGWDWYDVELRAVDGQLRGTCPCPAGSDGRFCEHIVAAGLAWLERRWGRGVQVSGYRSQTTSQANRVPVHRRAAADKRPVGTGPNSIRAAIRSVTSPHQTGLRVQTATYARRLESVLDALEKLLAAGHAAAVVEMAAYGLERSGGMRRWRYDPDRGVEQVDSEFLSLHLRACAVAKPDPADLARWLFHFELSSARAAWEGVFIRYVGLLGDKGWEAYRELAEAEWRARPSPRDEGSRLQEVVCHAALLTVDPELLSEVVRSDFGKPWAYHVTARQCMELGLPDKAVAWAELGVKAFPAAPHPGLRQLLAEEYGRRGQMTEALSQSWALFTEGPGIENYRQLRTFAQKAGQAAVWRDEALEYLRERTARVRTAGSAEQREHGRCGSLLVEILLSEKNVEAAWREAHISCCDGAVWFKLARAREAKHPADAVRIYQQLAEQVVQHAGDFEYRAAVRYLRRAAALATKLGRPDKFREFLTGYREQNKRKKNLLRLLDREFDSGSG
ncbi:MAG: hypothetical protein NTX53_17555 [candidate division WOR-3 bacterium]|nr:hypothetical protein [candidate division WOR-3 bacterium]